MDKVADKKTRIYPKDWESVLKSKDWSDEELDSIIAMLVAELSYMSEFINGYEPLWSIEDVDSF